MISDGVRLRSTRNIIVSAIVFSVITVSSTVLSPPEAAATETACGINIGGQQGYYICGTSTTSYTSPNGYRTTFVLGMDHAVWQISVYAGGSASAWQSLGGWGQKGVYSWYFTNGNNYGIWTYGSDGLRWCKANIVGVGYPPWWRPWRYCGDPNLRG